MRYTIFDDALKTLEAHAKKHDVCAVAFSGGKDSLVCLDLCLRTFKNVKPFFLFFLPGLRCVEDQIDRYEQHFGVKTERFPHWLFFQAIKYEVYCDSHHAAQEIPDITPHDIYSYVRHVLQTQLIVSGAKKADSPMRRRRIFSSGGKRDKDMIYPLASWLKQDVYAYLKMRNIPPPYEHGKASFGVDLTTPSILKIHDDFPEDYAIIERVFPYVGAVVARRSMYGIS